MSNPFEEEPSNPFEEQPDPYPPETEVLTESTPKKSKMASITKHNFQWHNYKRPTFCAHCGNLLVGMLKQGMRCKRCGVDVHDKCQEDLDRHCIELIVGQHNFLMRTYKQPTYCDFCKKLLVGLVNQGLKCSECHANVHEKCQEKINAKCPIDSKKGGKDVEAGFARKKNTRVSQRTKRDAKIATTSFDSGTGDEEGTAASEAASSMFATMPTRKKDSLDSPSATRRWSATPSPRDSRSPSVASSVGKKQDDSSSNISKANEMVQEVVGIMVTNVGKLNERGEKLDTLQSNAEQLEEKSNLFQKKATELKKKFWWKNFRLWIILGVALVILIAIIVVSVVFSNKKKG